MYLSETQLDNLLSKDQDLILFLLRAYQRKLMGHRDVNAVLEQPWLKSVQDLYDNVNRLDKRPGIGPITYHNLKLLVATKPGGVL